MPAPRRSAPRDRDGRRRAGPTAHRRLTGEFMRIAHATLAATTGSFAAIAGTLAWTIRALAAKTRAAAAIAGAAATIAAALAVVGLYTPSVAADAAAGAHRRMVIIDQDAF